MDEAVVLKSGEEETETLEERYLPAVGESCLAVLAVSEEAEELDMGVEQEDETCSVTTSLLQRQQQHESEMRQNHQADTLTPTDGADQKTSVLHELEFDNADQPQCREGAKSQSSDSSAGHECPICREPFDSQGDQRVALLNCNHTLCHRCLAGILKRAKDPCRVRCPFCRQNTPSLRWEILKMQEEVYSDSVYTPRPASYTPRPASYTPRPASYTPRPVSAAGTIGPDRDTRLPEPQALLPPPASCCVALERQLESHTQTSLCGCCMYPACLVGILRLMQHCFFCCSVLILLLILLTLLAQGTWLFS